MIADKCYLVLIYATIFLPGATDASETRVDGEGTGSEFGEAASALVVSAVGFLLRPWKMGRRARVGATGAESED